MDDRELFLHLHDGLPRQAPGSEGTTRRLLEIASAPATAEVLDIGCGPGRATLVIAQALPQARMTAVDLHQPYLDELIAAARQPGVESRVRAVCAPMQSLPFRDAEFDLVWSEGSIYIIGFGAGLAAWRRLLRPGGTLVVTEATWFTDANVSSPARRFWESAYPAMTNEATNAQVARDAGYDVVAMYRLPQSDWWDEYYDVMDERLDAMAAGNLATVTQIAAQREEIDLYRDHGDEYGYMGFVLRRTS
jgi:SAM-dependent methyltransferase